MRGLPRSIRARVAALAVVAATVLLASVSLLMLTVLRWQLTDNLDEGLNQRADTIAAALRGGEIATMLGDEDLLVQVAAPDGTITQSTPNLSGSGPITSRVAGIGTISDVPGRSEDFRVLSRPVDTPAGGTLLVAVNADDVADPVRIMTRLLVVVVPAMVASLGVVTWWLTGRTLRPVERIRAQMADITASRLDRRVPEPATGDEIDRLARATNQTLDRLEDAVRRQQRFVSDASHELRGPLTRIRAELELGLASPASADAFAIQGSVLEETIQLQRLVEDLLLLARSDATDTDPPDSAVDLDDIVLREARRLRERERAQVDASGVGAALVTGDEAQLGRAVRNLLDNAERHAATNVRLTLSEEGDTVTFIVQDDGAGVPAAEAAHIFDRFTRLDEARTRDAGGSGLGLAITREIVTRHGGTIHLAAGSPTRFVVQLPRRH